MPVPQAQGRLRAAKLRVVPEVDPSPPASRWKEQKDPGDSLASTFQLPALALALTGPFQCDPEVTSCSTTCSLF